MNTTLGKIVFGLAASGAVSLWAATPAEIEAAKAERAAAMAAQEAWVKADKAAQDRMRKDFQGGFANYWHANIDAAREMYESVLTNGVCRNAQKIAALRKIAQMHLEATRDGEAALAAMERAFALPGLTDGEKAQAESAKLDLHRAMRLEPPDPKKTKAKPTLDELEQAARLCNPASKCPLPNAVFTYFDACLDAGFETFFSRVPAMLKEYDAKYPKTSYWSSAVGAPLAWYRQRTPSKAQRDSRFDAALVALLESAPTNHALSAESLFSYANGKSGLEEKCRAYAAKVVARAADPQLKVNPQTAAAAKRFLLFDAAGTDVKKTVAACRECLAMDKKPDDKAALAKLLGEQAQRQLKAGNESAARALWDERLKIAPEKAQSKLDCPYWKDAPHDIRGILESDFYKKAPKGLFTHRYGDNLKFLIETDSAITSREMTTDKGEKFRPTELFAFCDAQGVKLFIRAYLDDMDAVRAGEAGVPGYETYLATGIDDPYHCIMFDPVEGGKADDNFVTQYDNGTGYRNLRDKLGNLQYGNLYLDDGVATLISVPWSSTPSSIPSRSPAWYFEAINWAHGGLSWGGSKSVHFRSNCGELRFTGVDDEALAAIRRTVLRKARNVLDEAKNSRTGGCIEQWMDPVLGDQEFYLAVVKPYVARIDADLARVTKDATPAVLADVFASGSVDDAINIDYRIALLRTQWLERKLTE